MTEMTEAPFQQSDLPEVPAEEGHPTLQISDSRTEYRYVVFTDQPVGGLKLTARGDDLQIVLEDVYQMVTLARAMNVVGQHLAPAQLPQMNMNATNAVPMQQQPFQPTPQNVPGYGPGAAAPVVQGPWGNPQQQMGQSQPQQRSWGGDRGGQRSRSRSSGGNNTMPNSALVGGIPNCAHGVPYEPFTSPRGFQGYQCGGRGRQDLMAANPVECQTLWGERS